MYSFHTSCDVSSVRSKTALVVCSERGRLEMMATLTPWYYTNADVSCLSRDDFVELSGGEVYR
jgi:hypothetical protein